MCENDVEGSKETLTVLSVTHVTHVKRVKSGVCDLCTQYRYIQCYAKKGQKIMLKIPFNAMYVETC